MSIIQQIEDDGLAKKNAMKNAIISGNSEVRKFYEDAVVFITGGSGFLGKHLIQKLISSSNIKKIYVLLRSKKGKSAEERLKTILQDPVYEILRDEQPGFENKIEVVEGDSADENLGLDEKAWSKISNEVNVIFHAAATINFKEAVKVATLINVRGIREILNLAKASKNLKSVVHVSTAYVQAKKTRSNEVVKEEFYECPIPPNTLIKLSETMDEQKLEKMIEPVMQEWPNSYTFTKSIAEEIIRTESVNLPVCIVRPAIVIGAHRDPTPGWIDLKNAYGPSGLIVGAGVGAVHTFYAKDDAIIDFVPVDIVNNALIVAAWETCERSKSGDSEKMIYTVTGTQNPIKYRDVQNLMNSEEINVLTPTKTIWYCCGIGTQYQFLYLLLTWIFHYIPGLVIDGITMLIGHKPRFYKIYKLAYNLSIVYAHFLNNYWMFDGTNTSNLYKKLSKTDKDIYNCEMSTIDKKDMYYTFSYGIVKYILKDDLTKNDYAMRRQFYFKIAHYILFPIYMFSLYKLLFIGIAFIFNVLIVFYNNILFNLCKC